MDSSLSLQIVLAIAGCIALLIGLFGGGVKAKEIEIPKIHVGPRILSSLVGMALIGLAIRLPNFVPPGAPTETPPILTEEPAPSEPEIVSPPAAPTDVPTEPPAAAPTEVPVDIPTDIPTAEPVPPEPVPELIQFRSPDDPGQLNPAFGWQPGNSPANAYELPTSPNALALIADGHTDQWADLDSQPMVLYSLDGNFETQVKVVFNPLWGHELAALGVRSTQDHNTWLRLGGVYAIFSEGSGPEYHIVLDVDDRAQGGKVRTFPYPANAVYLKIERQGSVFDFFYSEDGVNWTALIAGYVAELPENVEIFLTVGSWGDGGATAQFDDFKLLRK